MDNVDRLSNLPDFILHHILSFLPRKDANKKCVLSKRWNSIWESFPLFDFEEIDPDKASELMNVVDKSLNRFVGKKLRMQKFSLQVKLLLGEFDPMLFWMVDRWMALVLDNGVREMLLNVTMMSAVPPIGFYHYHPLPETAFVVGSKDVSSNFYSLQKLNMKGIIISENIIRNIVRNCPNLEHFSLWGFQGLKTLEISKLDKLETVIVGIAPGHELERIDIDAPNLEKFSLLTYYEREYPRTVNLTSINLTSCHHLQELVLKNCGVTDDSFHSHLSRFPFLENLEISNCHMFRRIRISAQRLKRLQLQGCEKIEAIEIDTPSLLSFRYQACSMPVLFSKNIPCPMEISYGMYILGRQVFSSWFRELRKFLGASSQTKFFRLAFNEKEISFDPEELAKVEISPVVQLDYLELSCIYLNNEHPDCGSLIDGLLWSCHPKTIIAYVGYMSQKNIVKVLCEKLLDRKRPVCCSSSRLKCWRHELRGATAMIDMCRGIRSTQLVDCKQLLDTLPSLTRDHRVRFNLTWNF